MKNFQCRAARALLGWSQSHLAQESGTALRTIKNFEAGRCEPRRLTVQALVAVFERHGLVLLESGGVDFSALKPEEIAK
jgi:DNA-binding XRE family transcriptional regulator